MLTWEGNDLFLTKRTGLVNKTVSQFEPEAKFPFGRPSEILYTICATFPKYHQGHSFVPFPALMSYVSLISGP